MSERKPMAVTLVQWKSLQRNTLRGFAVIEMGALRVSDVAVHRKNDRAWAQLPAKPQIQSDGTVRRNHEGKAQYTPVIEWTNRDSSDRFSEAVIAAIEEQHPGDTA